MKCILINFKTRYKRINKKVSSILATTKQDRKKQITDI